MMLKLLLINLGQTKQTKKLLPMHHWTKSGKLQLRIHIDYAGIIDGGGRS